MSKNTPKSNEYEQDLYKKGAENSPADQNPGQDPEAADPEEEETDRKIAEALKALSEEKKAIIREQTEVMQASIAEYLLKLAEGTKGMAEYVENALPTLEQAFTILPFIKEATTQWNEDHPNEEPINYHAVLRRMNLKWNPTDQTPPYPEIIKDARERLENAASLDKATEIIPYIEEATEDWNAAHPEAEPLNYRAITRRMDPNWNLYESPEDNDLLPTLQEILQSAIAKLTADREAGLPLQTVTPEELQRHEVKTLDIPLDKPNAELWGRLDNQLKFFFETDPKRDKERIVTCAIDFDNLPPEVKITRKLTAFDKRIYEAVASLHNGGNRVMTVSDIYQLAGYPKNSKPNSTQLKRINESLTKMGAARLFISNKEEHLSYPPFEYDASLLPFERMTTTINGNTVSIIHTLREPPMISFAKGRKQITTVNREVIQIEMNMTENNIKIADYLLERIAHIKTGKSPGKILLATVFENCGITTAKQKSRALEPIKNTLRNFREEGYIADYEIGKDAIQIRLKPEPVKKKAGK